MPLTHRSIRSSDPASLDHELENLQSAVARSRANRWHGGDVIEAEFEGLLATVTNPAGPASLTYGADLEPSPAWRRHRNSWREEIDETS